MLLVPHALSAEAKRHKLGTPRRGPRVLTPTAPTEAGPAPLDRSCRSPPGAGAPSTDANHASADESLEPPTEQGEDLGRGFCRLPETVSEAMLTQGGRPHLLESVWRDEKQAPRCEDAVRTGSASRQGPASLLREGLRAPPTPRSAATTPPPTPPPTPSYPSGRSSQQPAHARGNQGSGMGQTVCRKACPAPGGAASLVQTLVC